MDTRIVEREKAPHRTGPARGFAVNRDDIRARIDETANRDRWHGVVDIKAATPVRIDERLFERVENGRLTVL
jgi:hypothetical protein